MRKYPVTNLEFYRFINESGYKTEAQTFVDGIVYHRGSFITNFTTLPIGDAYLY